MTSILQKCKRAAPLALHHGTRPMRSGGAFSPASFPLGLLREQDGAEAVQIATDDGKGDVALESVDAMAATDVQSVHLQGVDGRLHCAVAVAQADELGTTLALTLGGCALALFWQDRKRGQNRGQTTIF